MFDLATMRSVVQRRTTSSQKQWFVPFSAYATGTIPLDWRKHRSLPLYDLVVRADAGFLGGKKLKLEGSGAASRLFAFASPPATTIVETCVCFRASGAGLVPVGGSFVAATLEDDGQQNEAGGRIRHNGSAWVYETWTYIHNNTTGLPDFASAGSPNLGTLYSYVPGDMMIARVRYDPDDKSQGSRGTLSFKIWKELGVEPAWQVQQQIPVGLLPGNFGIYTNDITGGAEYNWFSVGIDGAPAPLPADSITAHSADTSIITALFPVADALVNEDFAGMTAGLAPTGWTPYYEAGATWLVADDVAASSGKRLRSSNNGHRSLLYRAALGLGVQDHEVAARLRYGALSDYTGGVAVRINNNNSAVCAHLNAAGALQITRFENGNFGQENPQSMGSTNPAANEWVLMQLRAKGTRFKARYWREGTLAPVAWHHNFANAAASLQQGASGLYNYESAALDNDWTSIRVAT